VFGSFHPEFCSALLRRSLQRGYLFGAVRSGLLDKTQIGIEFSKRGLRNRREGKYSEEENVILLGDKKAILSAKQAPVRNSGSLFTWSPGAYNRLSTATFSLRTPSSAALLPKIQDPLHNTSRSDEFNSPSRTMSANHQITTVAIEAEKPARDENIGGSDTTPESFCWPSCYNCGRALDPEIPPCFCPYCAAFNTS
jgi:hypothetical protein